MTYEIEQSAYAEFVDQFNDGKRYESMRFGQAFYNRFNLHKMSDQTVINSLYELDGEDAKEFIRQHFLIR